jgi:hypothetical protein
MPTATTPHPVYLTVRLRGEADLKRAQVVVLVQAETRKTTANFVPTGQPFKITRDWSDQTVCSRRIPTSGRASARGRI